MREGRGNHSGSGRLPNDSVAQLVEQYTFNVWVLGSNPSGITKWAEQASPKGSSLEVGAFNTAYLHLFFSFLFAWTSLC